MKYSDSHEWVAVSGDKGKVGISAHAQKELGEIVYVELPQVGQVIKKGEEVAVLESTKAAADIYSPVSGKVVKVNDRLKKEVALINTAPEGEGYLFEVALSDPKELDTLIPEKQYLSGVIR